jgi:hypothetical protein
MKISDIINSLEYLAENLENPTCNSLEVGFRHSPLTQKEIIERYQHACYCTRNDILKLIEIIKIEGIENGNS